MPAKNELRAELTRKRQELSADYRMQASQQICSTLTTLAEFKSAAVVATYAALSDEVQLARLIECSWDSGKTVCMPRIRRQRPLQFFVVNRDTELVRNRMGILQPDSRSAKAWDACAIDFVVVPLLGFDRHCNRIGYGGGYYDRTFSFLEKPSPFEMSLAGVGFEVQYVNLLPTEPHDVQLDFVVTENRIFRRPHVATD